MVGSDIELRAMVVTMLSGRGWELRVWWGAKGCEMFEVWVTSAGRAVSHVLEGIEAVAGWLDLVVGAEWREGAGQKGPEERESTTRTTRTRTIPAEEGGGADEEGARRGIVRVCDEVKELLLRKNRAYGNSALDPVRCFSKADALEGIRVRIDDKLSRLMRGRGTVGAEDTRLDLMGYLVLERVLMGGEGGDSRPRVPGGHLGDASHRPMVGAGGGVGDGGGLDENRRESTR